MILKKSPLRMSGWYLLLPFAALLFLASAALSQDRILTVAGKVTDELDKPLNGVTIRISHTSIEMSYEGCRFFDCRRWKIANTPDGRQGGDFTGMNVLAGNSLTACLLYKNKNFHPHLG